MNKKKQEKKERNRKDKEWRTAVVERYHGSCVICGSERYPNAHHIIPRNFKEVRWDVKNGIILCPMHHKLGKFSAHKNALWFINWLDLEHYDIASYLTDKLREIENGTNN